MSRNLLYGLLDQDFRELSESDHAGYRRSADATFRVDGPRWPQVVSVVAFDGDEVVAEVPLAEPFFGVTGDALSIRLPLPELRLEPL